jgi:hypothetical protein
LKKQELIPQANDLIRMEQSVNAALVADRHRDFSS